MAYRKREHSPPGGLEDTLEVNQANRKGQKTSHGKGYQKEGFCIITDQDTIPSWLRELVNVHLREASVLRIRTGAPSNTSGETDVKQEEAKKEEEEPKVQFDEQGDYPFPLCRTPEQFYSFMHSFLNNVEIKLLGKHEQRKKYEFEASWTSKILQTTYAARGMNSNVEKAAFRSVHNLLQGEFFLRPLDGRMRSAVFEERAPNAKKQKILENEFDKAVDRIKKEARKQL
eukprot:gb/GECG01000023.1/.p1 GENE.gb/GECG01000023.1/~~gb/GECG01000023.1/.p1  ORF type:complete len:229 (+),score=33.44 gb/GECG01000023.1/:1-687(+)